MNRRNITTIKNELIAKPIARPHLAYCVHGLLCKISNTNRHWDPYFLSLLGRAKMIRVKLDHVKVPRIKLGRANHIVSKTRMRQT